MSPRHSSLLLMISALSACAPRVVLDQPDIRLPTAYERSVPPASPPIAPVSLNWERWWTDFNDPQLTSLIETSLSRSTTIRLAYARLAEARATRSNVRAGTFPVGSLSGNATEQGTERLWGGGVTSAGRDSYQATFYPSWELDLFGKLDAIRDRADASFQSSALDFQGVRLALAADVATSLFQARYTSAQLDTARANRDVAQQLADTAQIGLSHGLTSPQDAARLAADASSASAEVTRLTAELQIVRRSLLILIGTPDIATASLPIGSELNAPPALPEAAPAILLTRRPDVRAAELNLRAAALSVQIDRLALYPALSLQPGVGISAHGATAPNGGIGLWSIAAGLTLPILDRTRLIAALRITEARGQQAVVSFERAVQTAFGEAENALARAAADASRTRDLERAAEQAGIAFNAARNGYRAGVTDITTLLQVQRTWIQARNSRDAARYGLLSDSVAAIRAMGGGWNPDAPLPAATTEPNGGINP